MKYLVRAIIATCVLGWGATCAQATTFDFTLLNGGVQGNLSSPQTNAGVTATGFAYLDGDYDIVNLWLRNNPNDHGLGVCSEGTRACTSGGGDVNELSDEANRELIRLQRPMNTVWTSLYVSSLDSGGSGGAERGTLSWSNSDDPDAPKAGSFTFKYGDFGTAVEGNILGLSAASGFNATARYVFFTPGPNPAGHNNDYLVWKGSVSPAVPEPASLMLLGSGLAGVAARLRRKRLDGSSV